MNSSSFEREEWRPIPGWEGLYEASNLGRIRSLDRTLRTRGGSEYTKPGRVLKPGMNRRHRHVALCNGDGGKSYRVHRLVMEAFVGPLPEGMEVRHLDDDPDNNALSNLVYGTRSENLEDRVRLGTHHHARKTHCTHGHPFSPENTYITPRKTRVCRTCKRDRNREEMRNKRRRAKQLAQMDQG